MVGIILNTAATVAQTNLDKANNEAELSVARLSSGNRIIKAKDDVAGLAIGTILKTNVSTMRSALTNTAQAQSLLGIADSALDNIGQILQRQKALATQATSGTLDATTRGFLNEEFQNLVLEIDQIAQSTNFNGIHLIDGSLFTAANIKTDTTTASVAVSATLLFTAASTAADTVTLMTKADAAPSGYSLSSAANDGTWAAVPFTAQADGAFKNSPHNLMQFNIGADADSQANNFLTMVDNLRRYTGDDYTTLQARQIVSAFDFVKSTTSTISITAKEAGSSWNIVDLAFSKATASLNGVALVGGTAVKLKTGGVSGVDGALQAGGFSTSAVKTAGTTAYSHDYNSKGLVASTYAQGSVNDSILGSLTPTVAWTTGVNLSGVSNNPSFIGTLPAISASYVEANTVDLSVTVGGIQYIANDVNTLPTAATNDVITFYSQNSGYGSFTIQLQTGKGVTVTNQTDANTFATRMNKAFSGVDIFQRRPVTSFTAAGTIYPAGSTVATGDLAGSKFWMISDDFSNIEIQDVKVQAPPSASSSASISFTINGEVYNSGYQYDGSALALSALTTANVLTSSDVKTSNADGKYGFVNQSNPNKMLIMQYASAQTLSITSASNALALEVALKSAFGIADGKSNGGVTFQVGTTSADTIDVEIAGTQSQQIYTDSSGIYQGKIDITTLANANSAGVILDNAINTVTSIRAQVGSFQSRFTFAQASIQSSIENLDAARSVFLDADISQESTSLAQSQVRLQASISVLAQANQVPQSFLKLLG